MSTTVLVTGASGFVGRSVVHALLHRGYAVRALVRSAESPLTNHPQLTRVIGDVRDLHSMETGMAGVTAVVHLAARKSDEKDSVEVNVEGTKNLIEASRIAGVRKIVNLSTQSARLPKKGLYGSTKEEADRLFEASHLPVTTLRSSLVYGDIESGVFGTLIKFSKLPFIPMIGDGTPRFAPIHRDDLAALIVRVLEASTTNGKTYDVGGPDTLSLDAVTKAIMERRGVHRRIIHIPVWFALLMARVFSFMKHPPLTVSNVLGSAVDMPMDTSPIKADIGDILMRSFDVGLTQLFGPVPDPADREAAALLRYVLSGVGRWEPDAAAITLLRRAFAAHHLENKLLPRSIVKSGFRLGLYDTATRILKMDCVLQQKLLIAAAIAETQPASAELLLPKDRSMSMLIIRCIDCVAVSLFKIVCAIPLMLRPTSLKTHVGTV